jgi:hypothetical protein
VNAELEAAIDEVASTGCGQCGRSLPRPGARCECGAFPDITREEAALRRRERLAAGQAWTDSGQMFTDELGERLHPEYVSRRFRELAKEAGLPVIKFHAARHTAATLALEAGVDIKDRVRATRPLHDPDHSGSVPACPAPGASRLGRESRRAAAGTQGSAGDRIMTGCVRSESVQPGP